MCENFIRIDDQFPQYSLKHFTIPNHYQDSLKSVIIPHGLIKNRIEKMAHDIHETLNAESLTVLCLLKGGFKFCQELMEYLQALSKNNGKSIQMGFDFIRLKSYKNEESGTVEIIGGDNLDGLKGKNILIVEDIVDTGKTMKKLLYTLEKYEPKSVKVASLLVKRNKKSTGYRPDYIGFDIPDVFVIGYAMDYNEYFRDLDHICVINEHGRQKYSVE